MRHLFLSLLLGLVCLTACSTRISQNKLSYAPEFISDSETAKGGKYAILAMQGKSLPDVPENFLEEYKDTIGEDDVLRINLHHPSRDDLVKSVGSISQTIGFRVSEGCITLPDLGPIKVAGLSLEQARLVLQKNYLEQIADIEVFLDYKQRLKQKVELAGLVGINEIPVDGRLRLFEALGKARIPNNANLFDSYILRKEHPLKIDFDQLINKGDMSQNIVLRQGDKIFIADPQDSTVTIAGEVLRPSPIALKRGYIPLREALVAAGGINHVTGNENCIYIIRGTTLDPKIYQLSWKDILHQRNDQLLLISGDTVYVASKPIADWNRFINLLLPSLTGMQKAGAAYEAYKNLAN